MRIPGREFGSETPSVIYVALRWNSSNPTPDKEERMVIQVAKRLHISPLALRIYNLVRPSWGRGMSLSIRELDDLEDSIRRIKAFLRTHQSVRRIIVGGKSGPMPQAALLLKLSLPRLRIEIRSHHRARAVTGGALKLARVMRP